MTDKRQAVALQYDGYDTPKVTAKGQGELAERIITTALEHGIPLQEDPVLAGMLSTVELGDDIPETLYLAVAELLAFIYLLDDRSPE